MNSDWRRSLLLLLSLGCLTEITWILLSPAHLRDVWSFTLLQRLSIVAFDLLLLSCLLLFIFAVFLLLEELPGKLITRSIQFVSAYLLLLMYLLSWLLFQDNHFFMSHNVVWLIVFSPIQLLQHLIEFEGYVPLLFLALPFLCIGIFLYVCRLSRALSNRQLRRLSLCALAGYLLISIFSLKVLRGLDYFSGGAQTALGGSSLFARFVRERTGPVTTIVVRLLEQRFARQAVNLGETPHQVRRSKRVSMERYLEQNASAELKDYNVVVLVVESLRNDQLQSFGGPLSVMPAVDALAEDSVLFLNNYTQASTSSYADPAIFSGQYPLRSSSYYVYPKSYTYPRLFIYDVLKALAYRTAIFSSQNENWGRMQNYMNTGSIDTLFHAGNYEGQSKYGFEAGRRYSLKTRFKIDDAETVTAANRWIEENASQRFFLYLNLQNSHFPYVVPENFKRPFGPDAIDFDLKFNAYPKEKSEVVKALYADSLHYVDAQISRFLRQLEKLQLLENTIVVLTGDTGQGFWEHGFAGHANKLYNEVMKVPLLIRLPDAAPASVSQVSQHIDIAPSILGAVGLAPHPAFQGRDLFADPDDASTALMLVQSYAEQYAIVDGPWKLIYDLQHAEAELYNLSSDPAERRNLAVDKQALARELLAKLLVWEFYQLDYYQDIAKHAESYPPVIEFPR